jgi:ABC-type transporter Mla subunit MlaD
MRKRQGALARIVLIGVFVVIVAMVLFALAFRTVGEHCGTSPPYVSTCNPTATLGFYL